MAFQIQVRLGAAVMSGTPVAALEDMLEGGAGVEPDIQDVPVPSCTVPASSPKPLGGVQLGPGFDAVGLHQLCGALDELQRVRMRLAGVLVQKNGQWHTPAALARDAPVGAAGDHVVQPGAAVLGIEACRLDGGQRRRAQAVGRLVCREETLVA